MKKNFTSIIIGAISIIFSSCTVILPHDVSDNKIGSKVGISKTIGIGNPYYAALILNNNFSVSEAVKNGKITGTVSTIDDKFTSFGLFWIHEIIVTGE